MIFISHRGNIDGINAKNENKPSYIFNALKKILRLIFGL